MARPRAAAFGQLFRGRLRAGHLMV